MQQSWDSLVREMLARRGRDPGGADAYRPEGLPMQFGMQADGLYRLSEDQASEILQMRLQRLTGLEQDKIVGEYRDVMAQIADLLDILAKPERVTTIISDELTALRRVRPDQDRRAPLGDRAQRAGPGHRRPDHAHRHGGDAQPHRLHQEPAAVRVPRAARGGRGKQATATKEDDWIDQLFIANTHDYILCFSNRAACTGSRSGKCRRARASARQAHRQHVPAAAGREDHRGAAADRRVPQLPEDHYVFMATRWARSRRRR
jgi:DNA gyrase subunit A